MNRTDSQANPRIAAALAMATDTRALELGEGVLTQTANVFRGCFGERSAWVVADANTLGVAGRRVHDLMRAAGIVMRAPFVFDDPQLHAYYRHVEALESVLLAQDVIPIAVGSGTINDIVKLAAHGCHRRYLAVATAASMDGYTAYGASINYQGSKQTFFCPAPIAVIADMEIIGNAPAELSAAGYGDLVAKIPAGADWLLADALGIESLEPDGWQLVQDHLRALAADPAGIRKGDHGAIRNLMEGLLMTGFAMQRCRSSRPASGAEHQFSHLWDMQDHHHLGRIPLHGCKVAVGTLATTRLYESMFEKALQDLDIEGICAAWPSIDEMDNRALGIQKLPELRRVAAEELRAKHLDRNALAARLHRLVQVWPTLRDRLRRQLISSNDLVRMLGEAGAPTEPVDIGISRPRLRDSFAEAQQIRRRYTILDLASETGLLPACLGTLFGPGGPYATGQDSRGT